MTESGIISMVTTIVTGLVTVTTLIVGFLTLRAKLNHDAHKARIGLEDQTRAVSEVREKIDTNTKITKAGIAVTVTNAKTAAASAADAKATTESIAHNINKKLNGGVDAAVREAVSPIHRVIADHAAADEQNVKEANGRLERLEEYMHARNHDLLSAINNYAMKIETLLILVRQQSQKEAPPTVPDSDQK